MNTLSQPQVSVIMPVKNAMVTLGVAIDSILQQSLTDLELIIVDDGSDDETPLILQRYAAQDARVRVIQATGQGISDALNQAISCAQAPLIARMDADDISEPTRLALQVRAFAERPDLVLLGSRVYILDDETGCCTEKTSPETQAKLMSALQVRTTIIHPTIMARTDALRQINGYRKALDGGEDHDLYLRLARLGQVDLLTDYLLRYRVHAGQVSTLKQAKGIRASVASLYSDRAVRNECADPVVQGMSCMQMTLNMAQDLAAAPAEISKNNAKLFARCILGLWDQPDAHGKVMALRGILLWRLMLRGRFVMAREFWRRTYRDIEKSRG